MNAIAGFRKCTLDNKSLIEKVDKAVDKIYAYGKIPTRNVPALPDDDFDLLIGELLIRFQELSEKEMIC